MGEIAPVVAPPIFPGGQQSFGTWLFSGLTQKPDGGWNLNDLVTYPGQLFPNLQNTMLPGVQNAWQPYDGGVSYLLDYFANNRGGIGQHDPLTDQMMMYGGAGGPGNQGMSNMLQFGTPSMAGQFVNNMAQTGMSSPGAGGPMGAFASGSPSGSAQFMTPFLTGQAHGVIPQVGPWNFQSAYRAPNIIGRTLPRR